MGGDLLRTAKSLTDQSVANVLILALVNLREAVHLRAQREFAGPQARSAEHLKKKTYGKLSPLGTKRTARVTAQRVKT